MHVLAVKRSLEGGVPHVDELHPVSELRALVGRADAIVVTLPGTDATRGLLDAETLAAVKPGAVLVNVGRGTVIDEAALAERLQDGTLKGAALDVFAEEPLPQDSPLWGLENVIVTPHDIALVAGRGAAHRRPVHRQPAPPPRRRAAAQRARPGGALLTAIAPDELERWSQALLEASGLGAAARRDRRRLARPRQPPRHRLARRRAPADLLRSACAAGP